MMFWNRIFEDPRSEDTIDKHELPMTRRTGAIDNVSLMAYGNGRWA